MHVPAALLNLCGVDSSMLRAVWYSPSLAVVRRKENHISFWHRFFFACHLSQVPSHPRLCAWPFRGYRWGKVFSRGLLHPSLRCDTYRIALTHDAEMFNCFSWPCTGSEAWNRASKCPLKPKLFWSPSKWNKRRPLVLLHAQSSMILQRHTLYLPWYTVNHRSIIRGTGTMTTTQKAFHSFVTRTSSCQ